MDEFDLAEAEEFYEKIRKICVGEAPCDDFRPGIEDDLERPVTLGWSNRTYPIPEGGDA